MDDSLEGLLPSPPPAIARRDGWAMGSPSPCRGASICWPAPLDPIARTCATSWTTRRSRVARTARRYRQKPSSPREEGHRRAARRRVQPARLRVRHHQPPCRPDAPDMQREMWFQSRQMFPSILESGGLPGYRLLGVGHPEAGRARRPGLRVLVGRAVPRGEGGDHALLVWAPTSRLVFHVYHRCAEDEWTAGRARHDLRHVSAAHERGRRGRPGWVGFSRPLSVDPSLAAYYDG